MRKRHPARWLGLIRYIRALQSEVAGSVEDGGDIGVGVVVVVEGVGILPTSGAIGGQVATCAMHGVIQIGNVAGAIAVAIDGVAAEGGGEELHGAGGSGVGGACSVAPLAGLDLVDGGQDLPGRAGGVLDVEIEGGVVWLEAIGGELGSDSGNGRIGVSGRRVRRGGG